MKNIIDFLKGLTNRRVDWATRHGGTAYNVGQMVGFAAILTTPIAIALLIGFIVGRWTA